jgi:hypothetical protein
MSTTTSAVCRGSTFASSDVSGVMWAAGDRTLKAPS